MVLNLIKAVNLGQLARVSRRRHVSFVCKYQYHCILQLIVHEHGQEFGFRCLYLRVIGTINYENYGVCVLIICVPGSAQIFLPAQVPNLHLQVLMLYFLDVTSDCWLSYDYLIEGKFVQDCRLSCIIHSNDDDFKLHVSSQPAEFVPDH